jgi:uncharacterized protein
MAMALRNKLTEQMRINHLVLIPNTRCNMNCSSCYVPDRDKTLKMPVSLSAKLAAEVSAANLDEHLVLMWHGSEPLTTGLEHFCELFRPWEELCRQGKIVPYIHTNATLINEHWASFFKEHGFYIGTSLDGPLEMNKNRIYWDGRSTYDDTIKGLNVLKSHGLEFSTIAVITPENLAEYGGIGLADVLYDFFLGVGCKTLGINIEQRETFNDSRPMIDTDEVQQFWKAIYKKWQANPKIILRDVAQMLVYLEDVVIQKATNKYSHDLIPTVAPDGSVYVLSPEFLGSKAAKYDNFIVGNVAKDSLDSVLSKSIETQFVREFLTGVSQCAESCAYFEVCFGGHAVNKFSETNRLDITETAYCRNQVQRLANAILED